MSGGHFNFQQQALLDIITEIDYFLAKHHSEYTQETLEAIAATKTVLQAGFTCAQRVDWLFSGDDGEEEFIQRLETELKELGGDI